MGVTASPTLPKASSPLQPFRRHFWRTNHSRYRLFFFLDYEGQRFHGQSLDAVLCCVTECSGTERGNFGELCPSFNGAGLCSELLADQLYMPQAGVSPTRAERSFLLTILRPQDLL